MSTAISLVPAATTLHDMRSRGPPVDRKEDRYLGYGSLPGRQSHTATSHQRKRAHRREWSPYTQLRNEAGWEGGMVTFDTHPALVGT